jgi:ribosomal protein L19E
MAQNKCKITFITNTVTIIYSAHTKHQVKALLKNQCVLFKKNIQRGGKKEMQNTTSALET